MPVIVKVSLPDNEYTVVIRNIGPLTMRTTGGPGGERRYVWETEKQERGAVGHRRSDGVARLLATVFDDIAKRGDVYRENDPDE